MNGLKKATIAVVLVILAGVAGIWGGIAAGVVDGECVKNTRGYCTFWKAKVGDMIIPGLTMNDLAIYYGIVYPLIAIVVVAISYPVAMRVQRRMRRRRPRGMDGSRFCRPGGLPGGAAPDIARNASVVASGVGESPPPIQRTPVHGAAGKSGGGWGGKSAKGNARMCAILDTNAAVMYGKYANDEMKHRIPDERLRRILCDKSVKKAVTPAVMNEVWGLCRGGRLSKEEAMRIRALAVKNVGDCGDGIARMIKAEQMKVAKDAKCETAMRWLAAKRIQYQNTTGEDYGNPSKMLVRSRRKHLAKLCEMAAGDRAIMGEAALVGMSHGWAVLFSTDADMSLFADAMRTATDSRVDVIGVERE